MAEVKERKVRKNLHEVSLKTGVTKWYYRDRFQSRPVPVNSVTIEDVS